MSQAPPSTADPSSRIDPPPRGDRDAREHEHSSSPEGEISLGRELRRAREVRGVSIEQIAAETKINERYLHALENDRLDLLPGNLYARNFVRSIARTIGADEEELLDYFNYQVRLQQDAAGTAPPAAQRASGRRGALLAVVGVAVALVIVLVALSLRDSGDEPAAVPAPRVPVRTAAAVPTGPAMAEPTAPAATFPGVPAGGSLGAPAGGSAPAVPPTAARPLPAVLAGTGSVPPATAATGPEASPALPGATAPVVDEGPAPRLRLTFAGGSWVEVYRSSSDEPEVGLKSRGDVIEVDLDQPVTVKIANAGSVSLSVDGQPGKPLGGAREARTITIDRKNYRSFLK